MAAFTHTLSDGLKLPVQLKRSARKKTLSCALCSGTSHQRKRPTLSRSLPKLAAWLQTNEPLLRQEPCNAHLQAHSHTCPTKSWYRGEATSILSHPYSTIRHEQGWLLLPDTLSPPQQKAGITPPFARMRRPHPAAPAANARQKLQSFPAATALSNAKTFSGRVPQPQRHPPQLAAHRRTRFRGRLMCASTSSATLPHPNHSQRFLGAGQPPHTAHRRGNNGSSSTEALFVLD